MKEVQTLFVVVLVVWRLGGKKEEGLFFVFCGEREAKNQKKNEKSLSFFGCHFLVARVATHTRRKKSNFFSPKLLFLRSVRRRGGFRGFRGFTSPYGDV